MRPSTKAPAFQWYPKDWLSDERVEAMSPAARGCYVNLLCYQWLNGGSIRDDLKLNARMCRVGVRAFAKVWPEIKPCFAECAPGRLANARLERQRAEQAQFHEDKRDAGIASAEARREKFGTSQPSKRRTAPEQPVRDDVATAAEPPSPSPSSERERDRAPENTAPTDPEPERTSEHREPDALIADEQLQHRATAFIRRYPQLYARCRSGAGYRVREARDFDAFVELVDREADDERLDAMFELFLRTQSRDFLNTPGSPRQFLHMLPECDRLLRENGR